MTLPNSRNVAVRVTPAALRSIRRGHPWVWNESVVKTSHDAEPGALAVVFDANREFAAIGLWDPTSPIRVRILSNKRATIGPDFWADKFAQADQRRRDLLHRADTTGYRRIHGENDGLPGLVIDSYEDNFVMKLYSTAWLPHLSALVGEARQLWQPEAIVLRLSRSMAKEARAHGYSDGQIVHGQIKTDTIEFLENGHTMSADPVSGQKTGYFLDQRANRRAFARYASGAQVLDVFCSHGGFSVHAAAADARSVSSCDLSPHATRSTAVHVKRNAPQCIHTTITGDAFEVMSDLHHQQRRFDLIVIDPPSFASRAEQVRGALRAYGKLSELGLRLLSPGGVLMQASCTARIDSELLRDTVLGAAATASHPVEVLDESQHDIDHPISFAEGAYLKAITIRSNR